MGLALTQNHVDGEQVFSRGDLPVVALSPDPTTSVHRGHSRRGKVTKFAQDMNTARSCQQFAVDEWSHHDSTYYQAEVITLTMSAGV